MIYEPFSAIMAPHPRRRACVPDLDRVEAAEVVELHLLAMGSKGAVDEIAGA